MFRHSGQFSCQGRSRQRSDPLRTDLKNEKENAEETYEAPRSKEILRELQDDGDTRRRESTAGCARDRRRGEPLPESALGPSKERQDTVSETNKSLRIGAAFSGIRAGDQDEAASKPEGTASRGRNDTSGATRDAKTR